MRNHLILYLSSLLVAALLALLLFTSATTDGQRTVLGTDTAVLLGGFILVALLSWWRPERPGMWLSLIVLPLCLGLGAVTLIGWYYPQLAQGAWLVGWFVAVLLVTLGPLELFWRPPPLVLGVVLLTFVVGILLFTTLTGHEYLLGLHSSR